MRKVLLIICFTAIALLSFKAANAGTAAEDRNHCRWYSQRYMSYVHLYEYGNLLDAPYSANCNGTDVQSSRTHEWGHAWAGSGGKGRASGSDKWWSGAGDGYACPIEEPNDADGFSTSTFSEEDIVYDETSGENGKISIKNINGSLISAINSNRGAMYRITLWLQTDSKEVISRENILWDGGVYINNKEMVKNGGFSNLEFKFNEEYYEFTNPNSKESINGDIFKVDANSLDITIDIKNDIIKKLASNPEFFPIERIGDISMDNIVVTLQCHTGYGQYTDPYDYFRMNNNLRKAIDNSTNLSLNKVNQASSISILPNPANEFIVVTFDESSTFNNEIKVFNMDGRLIKQINIGSSSNRVELMISDLPKGIYSLEMTNNRKRTRKTFVKN